MYIAIGKGKSINTHTENFILLLDSHQSSNCMVILLQGITYISNYYY